VVKGFSDRGVDVKILIVGVADWDDELIPSREYPQYKGRHFSARRIPRMADGETRDILDLREDRFHVDFDEQVKDDIVRIASGYPAIAHSLALSAAQAWLRRAFVGNVAPLLLAVFGIRVSVSVKDAGVHVEREDLVRAVRRHVREFETNHETVSAAYEASLNSEQHAAVDRLVSTLAASGTTRVPVEKLAAMCDIGRADLESLVDAQARGLVERVDDDCQLTVRELRPYIEGRRFLTSSTEESTTT
jgi:hypothetical protein